MPSPKTPHHAALTATGGGLPAGVLAGIADTLDEARWADSTHRGEPVTIHNHCPITTPDSPTTPAAWWVLAERAGVLYQLIVGEDGRDLLTPTTDHTILNELLGHGHSPSTITVHDHTGLLLPHPAKVTVLPVEQSNTTLILRPTDGRPAVALKVLRRPVEGLGVEVPLLSVLSDAANPAIPALCGWATTKHNSTDFLVAVGQEFITDARDVFAVFTDPTSDEVALDELASNAGRAIATIHRDIARSKENASDPSPASALSPAGTISADALLAHLTTRLEGPATTSPELAEACAAAARTYHHTIRQHLGNTVIAVQPLHGDLHFGQMLTPTAETSNHTTTTDTSTGVGVGDGPGSGAGADGGVGGVRVLDFEGEPNRPLDQRRAPGPIEQDLAGLIRSADYAAAFRHPDDASARARAAERWRAHLVDGYREHHPINEVVLSLFIIDKAMYELSYELAHRPHMADIPRRALAELLAA